MAQNRVVLHSRFKEAIDWADDKTRDAVKKALDEGEKTANITIERTNTRRDYNLPASVEAHKTADKGGFIEHPDWFMRFFEFGTRYIDAAPFMRPGHRKLRSVFKGEMGDLFQGWRNRRF